ncbi:unnamed protein product [Sphagnum balticum]
MIEKDPNANGIDVTRTRQEARNAFFFNKDTNYGSLYGVDHEDAKKVHYSNCRLVDEIENTPLRISGPEYKIPETPQREIPINPETGNIDSEDIEWQTHQVMKNLKAAVEGAGSSLGLIAKTTILLADMSYFGQINVVYGSYF